MKSQIIVQNVSGKGIKKLDHQTQKNSTSNKMVNTSSESEPYDIKEGKFSQAPKWLANSYAPEEVVRDVMKTSLKLRT